MPYRIKLHRKAGKRLKKLARPLRRRVARKLDLLAENPYRSEAEKLTVSGDYYRVRVGDYRILYEIFDADLLVHVIDIDHRSRIYRDLP